MAFFKFRKDGDEHAAPAPVAESIETLRKRARYRLTGAALLVLAGVVGFPLLFDSQPRPIAVNIPIDIPDRNQVAPLAMPQQGASASASDNGSANAVNNTPVSASAGTSETAAAPASEAGKVPAQAQAAAGTQVAATKLDSSSTSPAKPAAAARVDATPDTAAAHAKNSKDHAGSGSDGARALALLQGKADTAPADAAAGRFVVQFGAFSDAAKAHEARKKVEHAGLKTYAQTVQGASGKKYRVRVGPFDRRADADKAAEKIRKLNLPATVLKL